MQYQNTLGRIVKWDNTKALLIFLVVFGHLMDEFVKYSPAFKTAFMLIYIFHMPLFIFLSGLFSKKNINENRFKQISSFFLIYLLCKVVTLTGQIIAFGPENLNYSIINISGVAWYAFAIFIFSLVTVLLKNKSKYLVLGFAVLVGCFAGLDSNVNETFALSRIVTYFPFFYLGFSFNQEKLLQITKNLKVKILSFIFLAVAVVITIYFIKDIYLLRPILTSRLPFKEVLGKYYLFGPIVKFLYYLAATSISFCVVVLVPNKIGKKGLVANIGAGSLQVYILHYGLIYACLPLLNFENFLNGFNVEAKFAILIALALVITYLCSFKFLGQTIRTITTIK